MINEKILRFIKFDIFWKKIYSYKGLDEISISDLEFNDVYYYNFSNICLSEYNKGNLIIKEKYHNCTIYKLSEKAKEEVFFLFLL